MSLPHPTITVIPSNEPDAVPALWNTRYAEIDANFANHEGRVAANETEITTARGSGNANIAARFATIDSALVSLDPDTQNAILQMLTWAISEVGLANREIQTSLTKRFQQGTITIVNRGVISGLVATKSETATRNLDLIAGSLFMNGIRVPIKAQTGTAIVPANGTAASSFCELYLYKDSNGNFQADCTALGVATPADGLALYTVTIPAHNTALNDEHLASCPLTRICRDEPYYPIMYVNAPQINVPLPFALIDANYTVDLDVVSYVGSGFQLGDVYAAGRLNNGFKIYSNGTADSIVVNWTARKLNL